MEEIARLVDSDCPITMNMETYRLVVNAGRSYQYVLYFHAEDEQDALDKACRIAGEKANIAELDTLTAEWLDKREPATTSLGCSVCATSGHIGPPSPIHKETHRLFLTWRRGVSK